MPGWARARQPGPPGATGTSTGPPLRRVTPPRLVRGLAAQPRSCAGGGLPPSRHATLIRPFSCSSTCTAGASEPTQCLKCPGEVFRVVGARRRRPWPGGLLRGQRPCPSRRRPNERPAPPGALCTTLELGDPSPMLEPPTGSSPSPSSNRTSGGVSCAFRNRPTGLSDLLAWDACRPPSTW